MACAMLAVGVLVGTGTLPADVEPANATGYGCTASGGSTLHEFEYQGTKYCTEEFKAGGTWTRPAWVTDVYLMVVGGGGGGCTGINLEAGSGGGGGGVAKGVVTVSAATSYTVTVGAGGASCTNGSNSSFVGEAVNWIGGGGGRGGTPNIYRGGAAGSYSKDGVTTNPIAQPGDGGGISSAVPLLSA
ncbi:MAG: glycine-rich domain-containing protein, partial [Ilumatobacteraceae bacterium]